MMPNANLNGWARKHPVDDDEAALHTVGRDAVVPLAVGPVARTIVAGLAHREVVLDVELVGAEPGGTAVVAVPLARVRRAGIV